MRGIFILGLLLVGCGSSEPLLSIYPWDVSEEEEQPPAELWHPKWSALNSSSPGGLGAEHCGGDWDDAPMTARMSHHRWRSSFWASLGGPFASPTRHWFWCGAPSAYRISSNVSVSCSRNSVTVRWYNPDAVSGLSGWLESRIDWQKVNDNRGQVNNPGVAYFSIPLRFYSEETTKLYEDNVHFTMGAHDFRYIEDPPTEVACLNKIFGRINESEELTERCGANTNCPSSFESP